MGVGLEKQLRPGGAVNQVVKPGRPDRFALAGFLAALVSHPRRPDFLAIHWGQQRQLFERHGAGAIVDQVVGHAGRIIGMQHVAEAAHAEVIFQVEEADMSLGDRSDADFAGFQLHLAQLHGRIL